MNRRQLLLGALATAALGSAPLAFAGVSPARRRAKLTEAWERAVAAKKPLLVIVVPDDKEKSERGDRFGMWLNNAPDQDLAPLANVELVAATLDELNRLVPGAKQGKDAWLVLVRVDQPTPTWRSIVVPPVDPKKLGLKQELAAFRGSVGRVLASEGLSPAPGKVAAAAEEARKRWVTSAPPGTHWATSWGCGVDIVRNADDPPESDSFGIDCGMGHVESYAARFLYFWDIDA